MHTFIYLLRKEDTNSPTQQHHTHRHLQDEAHISLLEENTGIYVYYEVTNCDVLFVVKPHMHHIATC